jgi:hypothetical protein
MNDLAVVKIFDGAQQVIHYGLDVDNFQANIALKDLLQVALCILHHQVDGRVVLLVFGHAYLDEFDDAWMLQLSEKSNIP